MAQETTDNKIFKKCLACNGGGVIACFSCDGRGKFETVSYGFTTSSTSCKHCNGTGIKKICEACGGKGYSAS